MNDNELPRLNADDLLRLTDRRRPTEPDDPCLKLVCPGWESMPASLDRAILRCVGTLRAAGEVEPIFDEYHPAGTHSWSANAPIALGWFPYNRSDAWICVACARPFLRYTEAGGYYEEERIRELDAALVVEPPAPQV